MQQANLKRLRFLLQQLTKRAKKVLNKEAYQIYIQFAVACAKAGSPLPAPPEIVAIESLLRTDPKARMLLQEMEQIFDALNTLQQQRIKQLRDQLHARESELLTPAELELIESWKKSKIATPEIGAINEKIANDAEMMDIMRQLQDALGEA